MGLVGKPGLGSCGKPGLGNCGKPGVGLLGKPGLGNCGKWGLKNFGCKVCFFVSCFAARLEVIMEVNIRAMRREATRKILDEAIVLKELFN